MQVDWRHVNPRVTESGKYVTDEWGRLAPYYILPSQVWFATEELLPGSAQKIQQVQRVLE